MQLSLGTAMSKLEHESRKKSTAVASISEAYAASIIGSPDYCSIEYRYAIINGRWQSLNSVKYSHRWGSQQLTKYQANIVEGLPDVASMNMWRVSSGLCRLSSDG